MYIYIWLGSVSVRSINNYVPCYHEHLVYSSVFMCVHACMHVHLRVCVSNAIRLPAG